MKRLLHEPLVHFLLLGALLFGLHALVRTSGESRRIVLTAGDVAQIRETFAAQMLRPPTREELANLIEERVREEVLYREALRMGLGQNDVIVRRRLAQKIQFLYEDLGSAEQPSDETLERFLTANAERYRVPRRLSFTHVYFSPDRRGAAAADAAARALLAELTSKPAPPRAPERGDPFMLQYDYPQRSEREIGELFGFEFARALFALRGKGWQGPVRSGYGYHVVRIFERLPPRLPPPAELREEVLGDWRQARREEANRAAYERLRERYEVVLDTGAAR